MPVGAPRRVTLVLTVPAAAAWSRILDQRQPTAILEGFAVVEAGTAVFAGQDVAPAPGSTGTTLNAGDSVAFGPAVFPDAAMRLDAAWFRSAAGATVVFTGVVAPVVAEVGEDPVGVHAVGNPWQVF